VALGAKVFVTSSSLEKIQCACKLGASDGVIYSQQDWASKLQKTIGGRVDVIIDGAGGDSINQYIRLLKVGGRLCVYGSTAGNCHDLQLPLIFLKNIEIRGTSMGTAEEFAGMLDLVNRKQIRPVVDSTYPLADFKAAFEKMRKGNQFGKIVFQVLDKRPNNLSSQAKL